MNRFEQLKWLVAHDPCRAGDRSPAGAVGAGADVRVMLRADAACRAIESADLLVRDGGTWSCHAMRPCESGFAGVIATAGEPRVLFYAFELHCDGMAFLLVPRSDGRATAGELVDCWNPDDVPSPGFQLTAYGPGFETPDWLAGAVMYQAFPDRFAQGPAGVREEGLRYHERMGRPVHLRESWDEPLSWEEGQTYDPLEFYGGSLEGVRRKLGYLASLGVEVLYLNPVFEARSNHRYDTADYERIDPLLGTNDEFAQLACEAHEKGISIVLDAVLSHTGDDSRYFNGRGTYAEPGAAQGGASPYRAWYDFTPQEGGAPYRCWWGDPSLPEVDERNPAWQHYILGDILPRWIRAGARGYRFDVADEVPDDVLRFIRQAVKGADSEAALIGEVWEDATTKVSYGEERAYALGESLDSVMNYPLRDALLGFALGSVDAYQLATFLKLQASNYPPVLYRCLMNLVSSHDVERVRSVLSTGKELRRLSREEQCQAVRSITEDQDHAGAQLQKMVAGLQFALPGSPCIYYGDERGMQGGSDPFCRATFPWSSYARPKRPDCGEDLTDFYRELGNMRKESASLRNGTMNCMALNDDALCIVRADESSGEVSLAVANRSRKPAKLTVDLLSDDLAPAPFARAAARVATCFAANEDGIVTFRIDPTSTRIFSLC